MAGWSFTVVRQTPEDYARHFDRDAVLASWTVGAKGVGWIAELVDRGEAECVERGGYPSLYTVPAGSIVAALAGDEPPSGEAVGMFRPREVRIDRAGLEACSPDQVLTIAVWDQS